MKPDRKRTRVKLARSFDCDWLITCHGVEDVQLSIVGSAGDEIPLAQKQAGRTENGTTRDEGAQDLTISQRNGSDGAIAAPNNNDPRFPSDERGTENRSWKQPPPDLMPLRLPIEAHDVP